MTKEHEYEVTYNHTTPAKTARVWWDGKKIQSDDPSTLSDINRTFSSDSLSGPEILEMLPGYYRSGYIVARKVKETK